MCLEDVDDWFCYISSRSLHLIKASIPWVGCYLEAAGSDLRTQCSATRPISFNSITQLINLHLNPIVPPSIYTSRTSSCTPTHLNILHYIPSRHRLCQLLLYPILLDR